MAQRFAMHAEFAGGQALQVFSAAVVTIAPDAREYAERLDPETKRNLVADAVDNVMSMGLRTHYSGAAEARIHTAVRGLVAALQLQGLLNDRVGGIAQEVTDGDWEFALRLVIGLLTAVEAARGGLSAVVPALRTPVTTGSLEMDTLLLAGIRLALGVGETEVRPWPVPAALKAPWFVYGFRPMSPAWRELTVAETPEDLAAVNIFVRERSLRSA